jgi:two-component system chemotaxis response regulator CheB
MLTSASPRVLVADDSSFMRRLLSTALEDSGFDVVGVGRNGDEALALCDSLQPDVLTLDLALPGLHSVEVLRRLKAAGSTVPVVIVSASSPAFGARAVDALTEGAFELVAKPAAGESITDFVSQLAEKVWLAAGSFLPARNGNGQPKRIVGARPSRNGARRAVAIACSTGGPRALAELVPKLPGTLGQGAVIVQHLPAGFTGSLAERLNYASELTVREAVAGMALEPTVALLAPGGSHLRLGRDGKTRVTQDPAVGGLRPRADLTVEDLAGSYGEDLLLVVLTGMGKDGLAGAEAVKARGGRILVEAESTCTVYGTPRAVVEAGLADEVLPLHELPAAIAAEAGA